MTALVNPCAKGLTPACFEAHPDWYLQAFAYKLLHVLIPPEITRRLPKHLWKAFIAPDVVVPPGIDIPDGTVVPPDVVVPPDWTPPDPTPAAVTIPPGTVWPPGWTPGDPLPPGVTIGDPFPDGFQPGDPLPPGVTMDPPFDPADPPFSRPPWLRAPYVRAAYHEVPEDWEPGDPFILRDSYYLNDLFPVDWEPGDPLPENFYFKPYTTFPPGWKMGDPWPLGIIHDPYGVYADYADKGLLGLTDEVPDLDLFFPPGFQPGDPVPPGMTFDPGGAFPEGWTPGDPWPDGIIPPWDYSDEQKETGPDGPNHYPFDPGPKWPKQPQPPPEEEVAALEWEAWTGPDIDSAHPWFWYAGESQEQPNVINGHLVYNWTNPGEIGSDTNTLGWLRSADANPPDPEKLILKIKITANVVADDGWGSVSLWFWHADWSNYVALYFGYEHSDPLEPPEYYVGDNDGEPMEIDLADYGITNVGDIDIAVLVAEGLNHGHVDYSIDYIDFV